MSRRRFFTRVAGVLLAIGLLLAGIDRALDYVAANTGLFTDIVDIQTPSTLFAKLDYLRRYPGYKAVVLGDSLIVGRTMEEHGNQRWRECTLDRLLARWLHAHHHPDALVMNLGINGALPADLNKLVRLLEKAEVNLVVVNVGLRSFSADFSQKGKSLVRPWLETLALDDEGNLCTATAEEAWTNALETHCADFLTNHWKLYQMRDLLQARVLGNQPRAFLEQARAQLNHLAKEAAPTPAVDDNLFLAIKARQRYQTINFAQDNVQGQALESMLTYLAGRQQKTLVFFSQENPDTVEDILPLERHRELRSQLVALVGRHTGTNIAMVPPVDELSPAHFLDLLHLNETGYEVLFDRLAEKLEALVD